MNIAYVIWIEGLKSSVLQGQVVEVLKEIDKSSFKKNMYLFAFQAVHRLLLDHKQLQNIKRELKRNKINLIIIPCLMLPRFPDFINPKWYLIPLVFLKSFPILLFLTILKKIDILHCRSYPIMLAAIVAKKINKKLKIIFDPRSPFPEENVTANRWSAESLSYRLWKYLEKQYLKESNITISITDTYVEYYKKIFPQSNLITIPNNVDVIKFVRDEEIRECFRKRLRISDDEIIFTYSGSMGDHWNNPKIYADFIIKLRKFDMKHSCLFLTPNIKEVRRVFDQYNIKSDEYYTVSVDLTKMPQYLSVADFGLNLMSRQDIRMSIKTCEYLAMGLPIIINSNVLGAKEIIEQYNVGLVVDLNDLNLTELKHFIQKKEQQFSLKCRKVAHEKFSTEKVAAQYSDAYLSLLDKGALI